LGRRNYKLSSNFFESQPVFLLFTVILWIFEFLSILGLQYDFELVLCFVSCILNEITTKRILFNRSFHEFSPDKNTNLLFAICPRETSIYMLVRSELFNINSNVGKIICQQKNSSFFNLVTLLFSIYSFHYLLGLHLFHK